MPPFTSQATASGVRPMLSTLAAASGWRAKSKATTSRGQPPRQASSSGEAPRGAPASASPARETHLAPPEGSKRACPSRHRTSRQLPTGQPLPPKPVPVPTSWTWWTSPGTRPVPPPGRATTLAPALTSPSAGHLAQNTSTGARSAEAKRRGDRAEAVAEGPRETSDATAA